VNKILKDIGFMAVVTKD